LACQSEIVLNRVGAVVHFQDSNSTTDNEISISQPNVTLKQNNLIQISSEEVVILVTVSNDTDSKIILSHHSGVIGKFQQEPLLTMEVSSGVSVKIPVTIPRIECSKENAKAIDISDEVSSLTALTWESAPMTNNLNTVFHQEKRQGSIQIPLRCLKQMIEAHESFAAHVCLPPLSIALHVNGAIPEISHQRVQVGTPLDLSTIVKEQGRSRTSKGVVLYYIFSFGNISHLTHFFEASTSFQGLKDCTATLEFCCARKNSGLNPETFVERNRDEFIWCGQRQKSFPWHDLEEVTHSSRLCFTAPGEFLVSSCVRIKRDQQVQEEIWWAPRYQFIQVYK
jgi:hypothetical protein